LPFVAESVVSESEAAKQDYVNEEIRECEPDFKRPK